jgi:DnaJ family protein C protein 2
VEEVQLLIKAANKFPGGVSDRWETIAAYIALHTGLPQRDPDDVIKKSKAVQKGSSQEATVRQLQFQKKTYDVTDAPSVRYDIEGEVPPVVAVQPSDAKKPASKKKAPAAAAVTETAKKPTSSSPSPSTSTAAPPKTSALAAVTGGGAPAPAPASLWTAAEQKLLESGLKAYPPSWQGEGDRWDKIAEAVPGRTKKECKLRVKVSLTRNPVSPHILPIKQWSNANICFIFFISLVCSTCKIKSRPRKQQRLGSDCYC